jgi:hypothetical protein
MKLSSIILVVLLSFVIINAQNIYFQDLPGENTAIQFRFMHPSFDSNAEYSFSSGVYELNVNTPVSPELNVLASLPFVNYSPSESDGETGVGNLSIAVQPVLNRDSSRISAATIGVVIPTAGKDNNNANYLGVYTNFHYNHKFVSEMLTIYANIANQYYAKSGAFYGFELGPRIWIPTGPGDRDTEFVLHFGLTGGINTGEILVNAELVGLLLLSMQGADSFSDRFVYTLAFGAQYTGWNIHPGIFYSIYLKENLSDTVSGVLGLSVSFVVK